MMPSKLILNNQIRNGVKHIARPSTQVSLRDRFQSCSQNGTSIASTKRRYSGKGHNQDSTDEINKINGLQNISSEIEDHPITRISKNLEFLRDTRFRTTLNDATPSSTTAKLASVSLNPKRVGDVIKDFVKGYPLVNAYAYVTELLHTSASFSTALARLTMESARLDTGHFSADLAGIGPLNNYSTESPSLPRADDRAPPSIAVDVKNGFMRFFQTTKEGHIEDIKRCVEGNSEPAKALRLLKEALDGIEDDVRKERVRIAKVALEKGTLVPHELNILANFKDTEQLLREALSPTEQTPQYTQKNPAGIFESNIAALKTSLNATGLLDAEGRGHAAEMSGKARRGSGNRLGFCRSDSGKGGRGKGRSSGGGGNRNGGGGGGGSGNRGSGGSGKCKKAKVLPIEAKYFVVRCLQAKGETEGNSLIVAENLISSDEKGISRYGLKTLRNHVSMLTKDQNFPRKPRLLQNNTYTAIVDGSNVSGTVSGRFAAIMAAEKAESKGSAMIGIKNCSNFGLGSYYHDFIKSRDLMCISYSRIASGTPPNGTVISYLNSDKVEQTNSATISCPGLYDDSFIMDLEVIPNSKMTDDIYSRLEPILQTNESGGKIFGQEMFLKIFKNVFNFVPGEFKVEDNDEINQWFIVLNPEKINPRLRTKVQVFLNSIRELPMYSDQRHYIVPGDMEKECRDRVLNMDRVAYDDQVIEDMKSLANELKVKPLNVEKPTKKIEY